MQKAVELKYTELKNGCFPDEFDFKTSDVFSQSLFIIK